MPTCKEGADGQHRTDVCLHGHVDALHKAQAHACTRQHLCMHKVSSSAPSLPAVSLKRSACTWVMESGDARDHKDTTPSLTDEKNMCHIVRLMG